MQGPHSRYHGQRNAFKKAHSVGSMFHLELGVDFNRGFSSGFSPPDNFRPFPSLAKLTGSQNPSQNPSFP